jgi:hypothetical protein
VKGALARDRCTTSDLMAAIAGIGFHDDGDAEQLIENIQAPKRSESALWARVL